MNRPPTIPVGSNRPRGQRPARTRRQTYTDFRELLELEAEAKRLSFTSGNAPSPAAEPPAAEVQGNALAFPEQRREPSWAEDQIADNVIASPAANLESQFPEPAEPPVLIVVDQRMTMFYGSRRNMKSVIATRAAALIAWRMLAQKKPVGAVIFNDRKIVQLRPHCSRLRVILILHALLNQNHALLPNSGIRSNLTMLNEALRRIDQLARSDSLVFLITDASGHDEETSRLASGISRDKRILAALVYDPRQAEFRGAGSLTDSPCARHPGSETGVRHSRGTLHGTFGRQQSIGRRFLPDEIPIISINTRDDVTDQMRRGLRKLFLSPGISLSELEHLKPEIRARVKPDPTGSSAGWNIAARTENGTPAQPWQL